MLDARYWILEIRGILEAKAGGPDNSDQREKSNGTGKKAWARRSTSFLVRMKLTAQKKSKPRER